MSLTVSASLPLDIINRIVLLSAIQQDKMYAPSFASNGRCSWKWNMRSSRIQKIQKVCETKLVYPPKTQPFYLDDKVFVSTRYTLKPDENGHGLQYVCCEPDTATETELYVMLRWTFMCINGYNQPYLENGQIYFVFNRGYEKRPAQNMPPTYWNGYLFHKRTFREIFIGTHWEFFSMPSVMGKYIYDAKSDMYEFVIDDHYHHAMDTDEPEEETQSEYDEEPEMVYGNSGDLPDDLEALLLDTTET